MVEVARLESGFVHYKENGQVLKGKITPADIGLMQVNCDYWCDDAKRLGLDLYNIVENVQMARHIYDTEGITSWVAFNQHLTLK